MRISSRTVRSGMGWLAVLRGAREPVAVFVCDLSVTGSSSSLIQQLFRKLQNGK